MRKLVVVLTFLALGLGGTHFTFTNSSLSSPKAKTIICSNESSLNDVNEVKVKLSEDNYL